MKKILIVLGLLLVITDMGQIVAKDKKKPLEDRVVALEMQIRSLQAVINNHAEILQLMDARTWDLNDRLKKFELSEDNKVRNRAQNDVDPNIIEKDYQLLCKDLDSIDSCTINIR